MIKQAILVQAVQISEKVAAVLRAAEGRPYQQVIDNRAIHSENRQRSFPTGRIRNVC